MIHRSPIGIGKGAKLANISKIRNNETEVKRHHTRKDQVVAFVVLVWASSFPDPHAGGCAPIENTAKEVGVITFLGKGVLFVMYNKVSPFWAFGMFCLGEIFFGFSRYLIRRRNSRLLHE